jgi:NAD-dependent SIR2 family protein deacetylase
MASRLYDFEMDDSLERAVEALASAEALLITAGAGMGVDSGLPDFRSANGFWRAYPRLAKLNVSFEQMAQPRWFHEQPEMAWAWYGHRRQLYRACTPHEGYRILAEWARAMPHGAFVFTSNVDGQFEKAGFAAAKVVERHGSVHRYQCTLPCTDEIWLSASSFDFEVDVDELRAHGALPRCRRCGALARPNVLMFHDDAWVPDAMRQQYERYSRWLERLAGKRVVVLECGAGTAVTTIRAESERIAKRYGGTLVRINPEIDDERGVIGVRLGALEALTRMRGLLAAPHV